MNKLFFLVLTLISCMALGQSNDQKFIKPVINLNHISPIKHGETYADELYFDITVLDQENNRQYFRVPEKPTHWSSKVIEQFKNIPLWSDKLKDGQKLVLLIALMEADSSPFNPDDLIGLVRAQVSNDGGLLKVKWTIPNRTTGPTTISGKYGDIQEFLLSGDGSSYRVFLEISKPKNK